MPNSWGRDSEVVAGSMKNLSIELPVAKPPRLLVVGEVVLDRYLCGTVERVSPEAPISVLHLTRSEERLGNAAFVAASVRALGGEAQLLSVVGADVDGRKIGQIATELGIGCDSLLEVASRPTIVKERLLGAAQSAQRGIQQMLRVDREDPTPLDRTTEEVLLARLPGELDAAEFERQQVPECYVPDELAYARVVKERECGRVVAINKEIVLGTPEQVEQTLAE